MILIITIIGLIIWLAWNGILRWIHRLKAAMPLRQEKVIPSVFGSYYMDCRMYYLSRFRQMPNKAFADELDIEKVYAFLKERYGNQIVSTFQYCTYNTEKAIQEFDRTVLVLREKILIEMGTDFLNIFFSSAGYDITEDILKACSENRAPAKEDDFEINIITIVNNGLDLKPLKIKPTELDIALYYNDDFADVDRVIKERLSRQNDKGIVLLHGLPGTGKTTYLRHLIGKMNKKVLFVSPSVAGNLMNPEFIDLLIDNHNAILVIEDAENIMMDRRYNENSSVSNLLNISDGLLSDCLNVQIICTFNSALQLIDQALLRKGRLIARYEFGKLTVQKAQQLSNHLGFDTIIAQPASLAEITNQGDGTFEQKQTRVLGFRQEAMMN